MADTNSRARAMRLQFATAIFLIVGGVVVLSLRYDIGRVFFPYSEDQKLTLMVGLSLLGYGAAIFMFLYLRGAISFKFLDNLVTLKVEQPYSETFTIQHHGGSSPEIEERISEISGTVEQLKSAQLGALAGNREELIEALRPTLLSDVVTELENRFAANAIDAARISEIRRSFEAASQRLQFELSSLSRRSNLNLVIGVLTTVIAVSLLTYMVLGTNSSFESLTALLSHYVPRVTVVLFIEVFSFFFLRLYRSTLAEIRSYQIDITALTLKQVALETAWSASDPTARITLAKELVTSAASTHTAAKEDKDVSIDPELITDLLQKFAKVVVKKEKAG
jgi:hypothetical protein